MPGRAALRAQPATAPPQILSAAHNSPEITAVRKPAPTEPLRDVLRREYTPLQAFCIMLFCLVSAPCMATLAATWKESGSWKWAAVQLVGLTLLAYVITLIVCQIGSALGIGVV